ncbi:MAG: endonuclease III, partial [Verrucomicrobiota bacterium]|nr:endonuclease III [Verrucomicrobiota bacterium]
VKTCGLANSKARNIKRLSEMLVEEFNGEVPADFQSLEKLPGVGHKTASVVMIHAFKIPAFPVDTHIHRLAQRWGLTKGKNVVQTEEDLKKLYPPEDWEKLHLQFITYGREHCTARGCDGTVCEICRTTHPNRKKPIVVNKA